MKCLFIPEKSGNRVFSVFTRAAGLHAAGRRQRKLKSTGKKPSSFLSKVLLMRMNPFHLTLRQAKYV